MTQDMFSQTPEVMTTSAKQAVAAAQVQAMGTSSAASSGTPSAAGTANSDKAVAAAASDVGTAPAGSEAVQVHKLTKVVIITRQNKLEEFMQAMNGIGVTGITVTNVLGCGVQKGSSTFYRGVEMDMRLLPKVKIEIVVSLVPVQTVVDTARAVLHTGQIGDGKIFIYDIENVVKIRTGDQGYLALQDTDADE